MLNGLTAYLKCEGCGGNSMPIEDPLPEGEGQIVSFKLPRLMSDIRWQTQGKYSSCQLVAATNAALSLGTIKRRPTKKRWEELLSAVDRRDQEGDPSFPETQAHIYAERRRFIRRMALFGRDASVDGRDFLPWALDAAGSL